MKFISSDSAVSEVVGHAIILAITIVGVSMIVLAGVPSILNLEDQAKIRNAEQTSTVLDSLASSTILGDSPQQVINMNLEDGISSIKPNTTNSPSYISIKSENNTFNLVLPMGKITYSLGERIVAYEGGGVWSKYPAGSVMLSPPEFHYDGRTLTLPVITLIGNGSIGGKGKAAISLKKNSSMILFPNSIDQNRSNPLNYSLSGKVYVNITSDYYDAWADYARNLIYTKVYTNSTNHLASIELTVVPSGLGDPGPITQPINLRGLPNDNTPLDKFIFKIYPGSSPGVNKWDIRAMSGTRRLIFFIDFKANPKRGLTIGYQDSSLSSNGETWGTYYYSLQNDNGGDYIYVDLLDKNINLTYTNISNLGSDNSNSCKPFGKNINTFNASTYSWDGITINSGDNQSLYNITEHYIWKIAQAGDFSFYQCVPSGEKLPLDISTMTIGYNTTGGITILHVQNNSADVSIN
jgi:hypothetical protein